MSVRIIAGLYKGRKLETPPGNHTRPLLDRIKQSLFDYLGQDLSGLHVADVCAGSGSFGFEAASRNAEQVHLIECDSNAIQCLENNLELIQNEQCTIHKSTFQRALPTLPKLDIIYADPPFPWYKNDRQQLEALLTTCIQQLDTHGRFLIRGDKGQRLPALPPNCKQVAEKKYGRSWVVEIHHSN